MNAQPTALDAYLQRLAMFLDKIDALLQLADDQFGHDPGAIHWCHVGDLGRVNQALDELLAISTASLNDGGHDGNPAQAFASAKPAVARRRPPC